jgi:hypothetical protein
MFKAVRSNPFRKVSDLPLPQSEVILYWKDKATPLHYERGGRQK